MQSFIHKEIRMKYFYFRNTNKQVFKLCICCTSLLFCMNIFQECHTKCAPHVPVLSWIFMSGALLTQNCHVCLIIMTVIFVTSSIRVPKLKSGGVMIRATVSIYVSYEAYNFFDNVNHHYDHM